MTKLSRRSLLAYGVGAAAMTACGRSSSAKERPEDSRAHAPMLAADPTETAAPPTATPTPRVFAAGTETRALLAGTASETTMVIRHSGRPGPAAVILGGVHGNEPGGWLAADQVATWQPARGSLIVVPRANVQAIAGFVRTTDEIGDLNRLYPGDASSPLLMERMAAAILATAAEFGADVLYDMHESWAFYAEYPPNSGTGALGQTVTTGLGPRYPDFGPRVAARANPLISAREQFIVREGRPFSRPDATPSPGTANRGRSSLSAGGYVPGLTPVLIEMGQERQPLERRIELHLVIAQAAFEELGIL